MTEGWDGISSSLCRSGLTILVSGSVALIQLFLAGLLANDGVSCLSPILPPSPRCGFSALVKPRSCRPWSLCTCIYSENKTGPWFDLVLPLHSFHLFWCLASSVHPTMSWEWGNKSFKVQLKYYLLSEPFPPRSLTLPSEDNFAAHQSICWLVFCKCSFPISWVPPLSQCSRLPSDPPHSNDTLNKFGGMCMHVNACVRVGWGMYIHVCEF